jgi:methionine-rich copper-binding protein CopC
MKQFRAMLLGAVVLSLPLTALAHAHLQQSTPANGSSVPVAPDHITLSFSEAAHLTALTIQRDGEPVAQKIEPLPKEASARFVIPAPRLAAGIYTLRFRNIAVDDGHVMSGSITFTITPAAQTNAPAGK